MFNTECHLPLHRGKLRLERKDMIATMTPKLDYARSTSTVAARVEWSGYLAS